MKPVFDLEKFFTWLGRLSKREKLLFGLTMTFLAVTFSDQLVVRPLVQTFGSLQQQIVDLKAEARRNLKLLAEKDKILGQVKVYSNYSAEAKSTEETMVQLLKHVEELANHAGINLLYAKPAGEKMDGRAKHYYVNLECEAKMEQLIQFFHLIENSTRFLKIEKYSIEPSSTDSKVTRSAVTIFKTVVP